MSSVWGMIFQWGSTIKVSIELPVATRHRRDMTENLLKATLNPNKQQQQTLRNASCSFVHSSASVLEWTPAVKFITRKHKSYSVLIAIHILQIMSTNTKGMLMSRSMTKPTKWPVRPVITQISLSIRILLVLLCGGSYDLELWPWSLSWQECLSTYFYWLAVTV